MSTKTTRITEDLQWRSYKEAYRIGNIASEELARDAAGNVLLKDGQPIVRKVQKFVNELQDAIVAGVFDEKIKECANQYHDGDIQAALRALARNLDNQRCIMNNRAYAPTSNIDNIRLETMTNFVNARRECKNRTDGSIPQWAYGPKEIDAIDDPAVLQKVINSISDVASESKSNKSFAVRLGENYVAAAKSNREYARKRKAMLEAKATSVSPEILAKLAKGKVALTADEAAALLKILSK